MEVALEKLCHTHLQEGFTSVVFMFTDDSYTGNAHSTDSSSHLAARTHARMNKQTSARDQHPRVNKREENTWQLTRRQDAHCDIGLPDFALDALKNCERDQRYTYYRFLAGESGLLKRNLVAYKERACMHEAFAFRENVQCLIRLSIFERNISQPRDFRLSI